MAIMNRTKERRFTQSDMEVSKKQEIINRINGVSCGYSAYEIFTDWIACMAMSISNSVTMIHDKVWAEREKRYIDTMSKYDTDAQMAFCEMTAWLAEAMDDEIEDVLGDIYMRSGMGSKAAGQFFTPFHISEMTARVSLQDLITSFDGRIVQLNEPSCGGGGMVIAAAKVLHENGIDYQKYMRVIAQDLDWKGVYMCYVQMSLLGINGICVQGNTLEVPYDRSRTEKSHVLYTPAHMGVLI